MSPFDGQSVLLTSGTGTPARRTENRPLAVQKEIL
jgi:hypothetical protein